MVVSQSFANKYPEVIVSYLQALITAQNWLAATPSAFALVSKWTKVKPVIISTNCSTKLIASITKIVETSCATSLLYRTTYTYYRLFFRISIR